MALNSSCRYIWAQPLPQPKCEHINEFLHSLSRKFLIWKSLIVKIQILIMLIELLFVDGYSQNKLEIVESWQSVVLKRNMSPNRSVFSCFCRLHVTSCGVQFQISKFILLCKLTTSTIISFIHQKQHS